MSDRSNPGGRPGAPSVRPRLVASDLDGTLLDAQGRVSPRTQRALSAMWSRDILTVFVTARPPRWLHPLEDALDEHGVAICGNGAFVYRVGSREMLSVTGIEHETLFGVVDDLRGELPGAGFAAERPTGMYTDRQFWNLTPPPGPPFNVKRDYEAIGPIENVTGSVGKLLVRSPDLMDPARCESVIEDIADVVDGRASVQFSGTVGLAEIGPLGVTKASALADFCARHGIAPEQVWAFGDMPNDVPMLRWAGRSFAVANAHEEALAAATDRTAGHDDDGVARVLETLL